MAPQIQRLGGGQSMFCPPPSNIKVVGQLIQGTFSYLFHIFICMRTLILTDFPPHLRIASYAPVNSFDTLCVEHFTYWGWHALLKDTLP